MSWYDNGGILGKRLDLNSTESYLIPSTGLASIQFVGSANGNTSGTISLTNLIGGIDTRPSANDLVIVSCAVTTYLGTIDPDAFGTTVGTSILDSWCAATLAIRPSAGNTLLYVGGTTQNLDGSTATNTSVNLPVGTAANDFVIIAYGIGSAVDRRANITSGMVSQGYTITANLNVADTFDGNLGVFYKVMGSPANTTVTIPPTGAVGDGGAVAIQTWRNIDIVTPLDVSTNTATAPNGRRPDPPIITPVTKNTVIVIVGSASHNVAAETFTAPTGYTTNFQTVTKDDTAADVTVGMGYRTALFNAENDYVSQITRASGFSSDYTIVANNFSIAANAGPPGIFTAVTPLTGATTVGAHVLSHSIAYKFMSSTPDTTITIPATDPATFGFHGNCYSILVFRYANSQSALDATANTFTKANGQSSGLIVSNLGSIKPDPPEITPITTGAIIVATGSTAGRSVPTPAQLRFNNTGLSGFLTDVDNTSYDVALGMYYALWPGGVYNPTAFTSSGTDTANGAASAITIALQPGIFPKTTTGNKIYSGNWNNSSKFLSKIGNVNPAKIISSSRAYTTATATSVNIVLPNNIRPNDLILIFAASGVASTTAAFDNSTYKPTGYTLAKTSSSSADAQIAVFYKVANGTESETTLNVPQNATDHMWTVAIIIRDALISSPIGTIGANVESGAVTSHNVPGITTSRNRSFVFLCAAFDGSDVVPIVLSSTNNWQFNNNSIEIASGGGANGVAGLISWKTVETANGSSGYANVSWSATDGDTAFQFEVESTN